MNHKRTRMYQLYPGSQELVQGRPVGFFRIEPDTRSVGSVPSYYLLLETTDFVEQWEIKLILPTVNIEENYTFLGCAPGGIMPVLCYVRKFEIAVDDRPHSRACGIVAHSHGPQCSSNCPTCGGREESR